MLRWNPHFHAIVLEGGVMRRVRSSTSRSPGFSR
ncbi:MAG: hypothetical protein ACLFMV_12470 [Spirochaetaceae bacterium]